MPGLLPSMRSQSQLLLDNPSRGPRFRMRYRIQQQLLTGFTRNITDPRALAIVLEQAEEKLAKGIHPDPYRREYNWNLIQIEYLLM